MRHSLNLPLGYLRGNYTGTTINNVLGRYRVSFCMIRFSAVEFNPISSIR